MELTELEQEAKRIEEALKLQRKELKKESKLKTLFRSYPELASIAVMLALWFTLPLVLRLIDPTAGTFDAGFLQIPVFAILLGLIFLSISWILLRLVFGMIYTYLISKEYESDFENLSKWQKITLSYSLFFSLFAAFVLLSFILS